MNYEQRKKEVSHSSIIQRTFKNKSAGITAWWARPDGNHMSVSGLSEVRLRSKSRSVTRTPRSLAPSIALFLLSLLHFLCFMSFFPSFPSPVIKVKYPSAMAACFYALLSSLRLTPRAVFLGHVWSIFWSPIRDDMFCAYFQTAPFCNANGCDSVNK